MSFKAQTITALLAVALLELALSGCVQQQGGAPAASPVVSLAVSPAPSIAPAATTTPEVEPSLTAAQQQGGAEDASGDFVFDLPDASDAQGAGGEFDLGMGSFG